MTAKTRRGRLVGSTASAGATSTEPVIAQRTPTASATQPQEFSSPPTVHISQFAIGANVGEILAVVGTTRMGFPNGDTNPITGIEWLTTLAMSPSSATTFHRALGDALKAYADAYGAIPSDPSFKFPAVNFAGGTPKAGA